ncbi:glycosyltransferase 87 family protein [Fimbriiglobus ruber]|uniref:DUF2029 domain-containing protein n=1 Tax=Fimbriiglobus ruber TaxID=1908690 RepID=A0A225DKS2_9BACT|nr:glycosyltransferase 87 family protein [Fimbriiglobus ruber]OWK40254.1 hypothetical protein FRUB_05173 [Fimbriiglobus ruber]
MRRFQAVALLVVVGSLCVGAESGTSRERARRSSLGFAPKDFVEYWSAARVEVRGGNPYDGAHLLPLQREAAGEPERTEAVMLWTPPWTLPLYVPFGLLDPRPAHEAWLWLQIACLLASAWLLWLVYGGPAGPGLRRLWVAAPFAVLGTTAEARWLLEYGQNVGFILVGLAGFLYLRQRGYLLAAGAVGALTAIKPHLLALFGLAILLDATTRAGRRVLLGGAVMLVVLSLLALLPNSEVFRQFAAALTRPPSAEAQAVTEWQLPLLSYELRWRIDPVNGKPFWSQFVPCAVACGLLVPYWWARRKTWDWSAETPRLVLVSALVAPYGGWIFDLVVLLVPVTAVFARAARAGRAIPLLAAIAGHLVIFQYAAVVVYLHDPIWLTPAVILWYFAVMALLRNGTQSGQGSA